MEILIVVIMLFLLIVNIIGIGVVTKNQGFILEKMQQLRKELLEEDL